MELLGLLLADMVGFFEQLVCSVVEQRGLLNRGSTRVSCFDQ